MIYIQALILLTFKTITTLQNPIDKNSISTDSSLTDANHKTQFFNDYDGGIFSDALTDTSYYNRKNTEAVQEKQLKWLSEVAPVISNDDQKHGTETSDSQSTSNFSPILRAFVRYFINGQLGRRRRRDADYSFVADNGVDAYDSDRYEDYEEAPRHFRPIPVF